MNFHGLTDFLKSRVGALVLLAAVPTFVIMIISSCRGGASAVPKAHSPVIFADPPLSNAHIVVVRDTGSALSSPPKPTLPPVPLPPSSTGLNTPPTTNRPAVILSIQVVIPVDTNAPPPLYAPYGRLLPCRLVNTVDSTTPDTPIIGIVMKDLWHQGSLIIPVGTEVHGAARSDRVRDRVLSSGTWVLVWQTGQELTIDAVVLDREFDRARNRYAVTDATPGLPGQIINGRSFDEAKLFVSAGLSGVASGLQQTRSTLFGVYQTASFQNAPLEGASAVLNAYAQQMAENIRRDGDYVRVLAGQEFYLYIRETLDLSKARVAARRRHSESTGHDVFQAPASNAPPASSHILSTSTSPDTRPVPTRDRSIFSNPQERVPTSIR